jgi:drug/metabolite transporter (DMT)-like permease
LFWRGLFASVFIGALVLYWYGRTILVIIWSNGRQTLLIALCSTASNALFIPAVQHTSVANAFTILAALPFVAAAIAWLWMRERPSGLTMAASVVALVGIFIMFKPTAGGPRFGDLLAILGTVAQALMTVAIRRNPDIKVMPIAWLSVFLSVIIAIPLADGIFELTPRDYVVVSTFSLVAVTCGQMLYMVGSAFIPSPLTALIGTIEAPIAALWVWIGVGEVPEAATIVGGTIVVASVFGRVLLERSRAQ